MRKSSIGSIVVAGARSGRRQVKSAGTKSRTEVRFTDSATGDRVELRYEPGRTEIK